MTDTFHTLVIGAGSGGLTVAIGMANLGRRTAVLEALHVGGDCTNVGCVPSKTLIHQAELRGNGAGALALAEVQRRRNSLREKETHEVAHDVPNLTLVQGRGRFVDERRVAVALPGGGERVLSAQHIVIATGARPRTVAVPGLPEARALSNETIFELADAPAHLAILGSGVIAMELACAFRKLGSQVTIITTSERVLARSIPEVGEVMHRALADQGIAIHYGATAHSYDEPSQTLRVQRGGQVSSLAGVDYVLMAVGRVRNLAGLGLEQAGVRYDPERGIATDSYGRTSVPHIYAIGDVTPTSVFTHSANAQGRRVVQRIAFPFLPARAPEPHYPSATFSDPEVATAGMGPQEIARRYHPGLIRRIRVELASQTDRGYTDGLEYGFISVDAVRLTGQILGATIVGPRASEMIPFFTLAIQEKISLYKVYRVVQPYPTYSSGIQKVADTFMRETLPKLGRELTAYLRHRWAKPEGRPEARRQTA